MTATVPAHVRAYVGIPFLPKGRDRNGLDCHGLLRLYLLEQYGVELPSYDDRYASALDRAEIARIIAGELGPWRWIPEGDAREGDGVLFLLAGEPCHVGVVVAPPRFLHVREGTDSCIEDWTTLRWRRRFAGVFRHEALP